MIWFALARCCISASQTFRPGLWRNATGSQTDAAQVKGNLDSVNRNLSAEQLAHLNPASAIELGFPHGFFNQDMPQQFILGGEFKQIDNHRYSQIHAV